ncbi:CubicO group peptidase, beta-lactamase class C family [Aquiflexum balticum DSM 16537]|uniref:CubicO group peptidase, beta-lactamase class C family n=1 Tax=Aquiflexum balticum DSM 16537 TaxID=758820 RepID=A0A1W2H3C3_9BACT|nr:serine hydrolase domain-containing protein [Aquiflexum balticum]SMD42976.1 CubicO group peptidase, beta-lactamase class C family [Aquiflexum balticum DSM 16537]
MKTLSKTFLLFLIPFVFAWSCSEDKDDNQGPQLPVTQEDIAVIDNQISQFISKWEYPGATLAISKNGKLVYSKAYGLADVEANQSMTTDHRMRIASISKTFTGIAILRLVQDGQLGLDDKVFGDGGILGNDFGTKAYSERVKNVTIRHLLQMTTGGWVLANDWDAIDSSPNLNNKQFFDWMLDNALLKYDPGTRYWYVNTNYFVAARVIEKVSGKSFFQFMKDDFLDPLEINSAIMAKRNLADRFPNEVKYYGLGNIKGFEYGFNIERRDGDGGMVISAKDLLKFVLAINGRPDRTQLLEPAIHQEFVKGSGPSPLNNTFGLGIVKSQNGISFSGALPGTRTVFQTNSNTGLAAVLLFNGCVDYTNATLWNNFNQEFFALANSLVSQNTNVYKDIDQF